MKGTRPMTVEYFKRLGAEGYSVNVSIGGGEADDRTGGGLKGSIRIV
jgi:hypothetical protein